MTKTTEVNTCKTCGREMVIREHPTALDAWCGTWYDHPSVNISECGQRRSSVLVLSDALIAQNSMLASA